MGKKADKFKEIFDIFPQRADGVEDKTWTGAIVTFLTIIGAIIYTYFFVMDQLEDPFVTSESIKSLSDVAVPIRIKCRAKGGCWVSAPYQGLYGADCAKLGGGLEGRDSVPCKKINEYEEITISACYDPDSVNGPKIVSAFPQSVPAQDSTWLSWEFNAGIIVHMDDPKTGKPKNVEMPVHFGTNLIHLNLVENLTHSDTTEHPQNSYQFRPTMLDKDGTPQRAAALRNQAASGPPFFNPCFKDSRSPLNAANSGQYLETRLRLMPSYRHILVERKDILTLTIGAIGGFFSMLMGVGAIIVPAVLFLRGWRAPVVARKEPDDDGDAGAKKSSKTNSVVPTATNPEP